MSVTCIHVYRKVSTGSFMVTIMCTMTDGSKFILNFSSNEIKVENREMIGKTEMYINDLCFEKNRRFKDFGEVAMAARVIHGEVVPSPYRLRHKQDPEWKPVSTREVDRALASGRSYSSGRRSRNRTPVLPRLDELIDAKDELAEDEDDMLTD